MAHDLESKLTDLLVHAMSDSFNRSVNALEKAGADTSSIRSRYSGIGSEYYDLVTEQIEYSAMQTSRNILAAILPDHS